jgi:hypothetical protein
MTFLVCRTLSKPRINAEMGQTSICTPVIYVTDRPKYLPFQVDPLHQ